MAVKAAVGQRALVFLVPVVGQSISLKQLAGE